MKSLINNAVVATALALSLASVVPALAAPLAGADVVKRTEVVKYGDLNLATSADAATLYSRIRTAARRVCRDVVPAVGAGDRFARLTCMKELLDTAVKDVDRPTLTALHEGRATDDLTAQR